MIQKIKNITFKGYEIIIFGIINIMIGLFIAWLI